MPFRWGKATLAGKLGASKATKENIAGYAINYGVSKRSPVLFSIMKKAK